VHPSVYFLPLSLIGPKGEGDKGGEGYPVGLGGIPSAVGVPLVGTLPANHAKIPILSPQRIKAIRQSYESQYRHTSPPLG